MMSKAILFDLPTKAPRKAWSLNPWKSRLVLNYKGIDYETEWTAYPDIAPKFKAAGLPPNETGTPYTIPTIRLGDRYVTDSKNIARELEALHPSPPLYLDDLTLAEAEAIQNELLASFRYVTLPKVAARLLPERDFEYFVRTREAAFGTTLPKLEEEKGEEAWTNSEPAIQKWAELLKRNGGPFVKGKTVSYADFILVGLLQFLKTIGDDVFDRFVGYDPVFKEVFEASAEWLKRDDH